MGASPPLTAWRVPKTPLNVHVISTHLRTPPRGSHARPVLPPQPQAKAAQGLPPGKHEGTHMHTHTQLRVFGAEVHGQQCVHTPYPSAPSPMRIGTCVQVLPSQRNPGVFDTSTEVPCPQGWTHLGHWLQITKSSGGWQGCEGETSGETLPGKGTTSAVPDGPK